MSKSWYILQVFTGYEQKIEGTLKRLLSNGDIDSDILTDVRVPMETILEEVKDKKTGEKKTRERKAKLLPGYVLVEMDLPEENWKVTCNTIIKIQGVTSFVGVPRSERPKPISSDEAKRIFQQSGDLKGEKKFRTKQSYDVGDKVKITEGPFNAFDGTVEEVSNDKTKLKVTVQIFGRATRVELECNQVQKI